MGQKKLDFDTVMDCLRTRDAVFASVHSAKDDFDHDYVILAFHGGGSLFLPLESGQFRHRERLADGFVCDCYLSRKEWAALRVALSLCCLRGLKRLSDPQDACSFMDFAAFDFHVAECASDRARELARHADPYIRKAVEKRVQSTRFW